MDCLFSVVIPVYNVENYIAKCLDSVLIQNFSDFEIICVNDSSPDNSRQIIEQYTTSNNNVICVDRPNGGLSAARNSGIKAAKGEYIIFLDSDDWLEEDVLSRYSQILAENDLDALIGNTRWVYPDKTKEEDKSSAELVNQVKTGVEALTALMNSGIYAPMAYNYIVKKSFITDNSLFFKEGLLFEDELWTPQMLFKATKVLGTHFVHYNYLQRPDTITNSEASVRKIDSYAYVASELIELSKQASASLKENLWFRACVLYNHKLNMQRRLKNYDNQFRITWAGLLKSSKTFRMFNNSLGFLHYSVNQRRVIRMITKLVLK